MSNVSDHGAGGFIEKKGQTALAGKVGAVITVLLWSAAIVACMGYVLHYTNTPGQTGESPTHWPVNSQIALNTNCPTLLLFAHPHCPCTRATLSELDQLMSDCPGQVNAQVWFIKPGGTEANWTNTDLWSKASAIPGVSVHCDTDGVEAQRFRAETSGQALLYDRDGQLLFHGGITIARGHAGDNPGLSAVEALLQRKISSQVQTPVFGCQLMAAPTNESQIACAACKR